MSERHDNLNGPEAELAEALGALQPAPGSGRDALLFEAGRKSARTGLWTLRGVAAGLAAMLVMALFLRPGPEVRVETRVVEGPAPAEPRWNIALVGVAGDRPVQIAVDRHRGRGRTGGGLNDYLQLRQAVLHRGWQALPAPDRPRRSEPNPPVRPFMARPGRLGV